MKPLSGREKFAARFDVSRETLERFDIYADLLRKWNKRINLVSPGTLDEIWERHFLDSAQLVDLAPAGVKRWVDLGSGAGFPGLVVAILAREKRPNMETHLVESDKRKGVFLHEVARNTGTRIHIHNRRIENLDPLRADVISARALAPLVDLLPMQLRHGSGNALGLFPKGRRYLAEIEDASTDYHFDVETTPSEVDDEGVVLAIRNVKDRKHA